MAKKKSAPSEILPVAEKIQTRVRVVSAKPEFMQGAATDPFRNAGGGAFFRSTPDFASTQGRRGAEVSGLSTGPSTTNIVNSAVARYRSRYAVLTNPHAKHGIDVLVSNVVGTGHRMISNAPNPEFKKFIEDLWQEWCMKADSVGQLSYSGLEALAFRSMLEGGDCFIRLRPRFPEDGLPVPLQLQLIEAEQVPVTKNENLGVQYIVGGIQFDALGKPVIYHMTRSHPGEFMTLLAMQSIETVPIPARDVLHLHEIKRPGDVRGMPALSQALVKLHDLDRYLDAEMMRKKAAALIGGYIRAPLATDATNPFLSSGKKPGDYLEVEIEALEPGTFPILPPGYDVTVSQPADVGANFAVFLKHHLRTIALTLNETYEQISGDLSEANDRTLRASLLEFKRVAKQYQQHILQFQMHQPTFDRWFDLGVLSGSIIVPAGMTMKEAKKASWIPDPWEYQNPAQEINALKAEIRSGFKSRSEVITERGGVPEDVDNQIAMDNKRADELGLVLDTIPSKVSNAGVTQFTDPNALDESAPVVDKDKLEDTDAPEEDTPVDAPPNPEEQP